MEKIICSCGTEFDTKFCPECGNAHRDFTPEAKPIHWWSEFAGEYETSEESRKTVQIGRGNEYAHLSISQDGELLFRIDYPMGTVEYISTLGESTSNSFVLTRKDGKALGEGHACQPGCSANIYKISKNEVCITAPTLPPPVMFCGFSYTLVKIPTQ